MNNVEIKNLKAGKKKGFTLVEVLVVVVILAIMASLIIPRFTSKPENAYVGEAVAFLGALRRGQINYYDQYTSYVTLSATVASDAISYTDSQWTNVGMKTPDSSAKFVYTCDATNARCNATRRTAASSPAATAGGIIRIDLATAAITCDPDITTAASKKYIANSTATTCLANV